MGVRIYASGVKTTFLKGGKEINFEDGSAMVSKEEAKELLNRPGGVYRAGLDGETLREEVPSFSRLEHEYQGLFMLKRLPELRRWLATKVSEIEPALLSMQVEGQQPILPGQEAVFPPGLPVSMSELLLGQQEMNVDGIKEKVAEEDEVEDEDEVIKRAKEILKKRKKKKKRDKEDEEGED